MKPSAIALVLVALTALPVSAEPPTGFTEFAWGTKPNVIRQQFIPTRCRSFTENHRGWYSLQCNDYLTEGLSVPVLRLYFEPADSLAGYQMVVSRGSYR